MGLGHGAKRPAHLAFIRRLPCAVCGVMFEVEAAHVRFNDAARGKLQALGQKPDDRWTAPLCAYHHRTGPGAQHSGNERAFWEKQGIDVLALCERLFEVSGDVEGGTRIVMQARRLR